MSNPINQIFNEPAIKAQVNAVLALLAQLGEAMKNVQKAADQIKIGRNDVQNARNTTALAREKAKLAEIQNKVLISEEKLATAIAKRAAAEAYAARATGQQVNNVSEIDRLTRLYEEGLRKLNGTLTTEAEKLAQVRVANAEVSKQLKQQAREVLGLSGAYDKLQQEFTEAKIKAQNLGAQLGVNSTQYKEAAAAALQLNNSLKAIDAGVGGFQRNVGNYASGFQNFTQVLREMPNFAISATVGVQSLSNNIPMLAAEMQAARAAGMSWGGVMLGLGKQLLGFQTILILAVTALTALPGILREMGKEAKEAEDEMRTFFQGITKEQTNLKTLFAVAKDVNQEMSIRKNAVKELRDQYGNYLANLSDEQILAGKTAGAYEALSEAIVKSAKARAASDKITKLQAEQLMDEEKMATIMVNANKKVADAEIERARRMKMSISQRQLLAPVATNKEIFDAASKENLEIAKRIADRSAEVNRLTQTVMQNQIKPFKTGDDKAGKSSEKEYFSEVNRLRIADLERANVYFKAIRDDDAYSYEVRLEAARRFAINEQQILDAQLKDELDKNDFNLKNKKDAKNEEKGINAKFRVEQAQAEIDYIDVVAAMQEKARKEKADRDKKSLEDSEKQKEQITQAAEDKLEDATLRADEQLYKELRGLNIAFINGEIKDHEDYEKQKTAITQKYAIKRIEAEIKAAEALLAVSELGSKEQQKYATQLADLKNKLLELGVNATIKAGEKESKEDKKRVKGLESDLRDINRAVNTITSAINELGSARFEQMQAALESEKNAIEKNAALELERINNSTLSEKEKADQIIILEARKQAQIEENDRKRRKLEQERARFERLNSIASIISGTALAVVNALGDKATPGPLRIVLAAAIGALGAAQLARAIATPIPKYKHGTGYHKGGLAVVGDGGKSERVILPSGEQFDTPSKSTLVNLPRGSKVLPDAKLASKIMLNNMPRKVQVKTNDRTVEAIDMQTRLLTKAMIKNKPRVSTKVNVNLGRDFYLYKNVFE